MDKQVSGMLMWLFTFILLIGFLTIYKNLDGNVMFYNRYEGLYIALFGLICSVYVGVKTSRQGIEGFKSLYDM